MSSTNKQQKLTKFPVIYYEEQDKLDGGTNPIPYIEVEKEEPWPYVLFIQEYRQTGEHEPDNKGNPVPIYDMVMHQYVDMTTLKDRLSEDTYDIVRTALGMKPLKQAQEEGAKLLDKVEKKITAAASSASSNKATDTKKETLH